MSPAKIFFYTLLVFFAVANLAQANEFFPAINARNVNPDTYLSISFDQKPVLQNKGKIKVYDATRHELVDVLDMAIPPGPKNTRMPEGYQKMHYKGFSDSIIYKNRVDVAPTDGYQINYIGGKTKGDAHHFYPVLIEGKTAKIFLHNNALAYGKTYYVVVENGVLEEANGASFEVKGQQWKFTTKNQGPRLSQGKITVSTSGEADFTTIQGAIDFLPENNKTPINIFIEDGVYDEIVNFQHRNNVSFIGESREGTIIRYYNNGVFNMRDISPDPKLNGGRHHIRSVFSVTHATNIKLANLTFRSAGDKGAQAEALLLVGDKINVQNVFVDGSGDALQATGRIYIANSTIKGIGDNVLGYGAVFFKNCELISTGGPHLWVRNTDKNHGNVFVNCIFRTDGNSLAEIARAPDNHGIKYPYAEAVLIDCKLQGLKPEGWGTVAEPYTHVRYWEFNSATLEGKPLDFSKRHMASKRLDAKRDAEIIKQYRNPSYVLAGWNPEE